MFNKLLLCLSALTLTSSVCLSQSVTFAVEKATLFFSDGELAGRSADNSVDNRSLINVFAGFVTDKSAFESEATSIESLFNFGNFSQAVSDLNTSLLSSVSWVSVPQASGVIANTRDFNLSSVPASEGQTPLLLITTSSGTGNLSLSDEFGILTNSSFTVSALGLETLSFFSSDNTWNQSVFGSLDSGANAFSLQAVPEPSAYASLAGICALTWVMLRRRRA